ncbi:MAG: hypothetical protein ACYCRD_08640 [Leptospirillum sp.]
MFPYPSFASEEPPERLRYLRNHILLPPQPPKRSNIELPGAAFPGGWPSERFYPSGHVNVFQNP